MQKYKTAFVWRFQTTNCGDLASSPCNFLYFESGVTARVDISCDLMSNDISKILDNSETIIIGGGGLIGLNKYTDKINYLVDKYSEKIFIWGAGSNWIKQPTLLPQINNCYYSGIRDFPLSVPYDEFPTLVVNGVNYLPCASALDTYFLSYWKSKILKFKKYSINKTTKKSLRILLASNNAGGKPQSFYPTFVAKLKKLLSRYYECTILHLENSKINMSSCLDIIQSADIIFTRSYHFAYWSLLMGKPVIGIRTTSKLNSFPLNFNQYLLFSSFSELSEFIESFDQKQIDKFVFNPGSQMNIQFYLQSLLLNCSAAYTLYSKIKDIDSYHIFISKYCDLLRILPYGVFNQIGIYAPKRREQYPIHNKKFDRVISASEIRNLTTLYIDQSSLNENIINPLRKSTINSLTEQKLRALRQIQASINKQVNYSISLDIISRIKRKFTAIRFFLSAI